jgi:hypothetical protein
VAHPPAKHVSKLTAMIGVMRCTIFPPVLMKEEKGQGYS